MTDGPSRSADIDLDLLHDLVFGLRLERPEPGSALQGRYHSATDIPVTLDAPFGPAGPMLFRFGDMLSLLFGWSTIQSAMRISDPDHLLFDYTRVMMGFRLFRPKPKRIEMIGLGGGSLAKACYRCLPDCDITVVEIDPEVIALREKFKIPPDDRRFRVICADGVDYLATAATQPDVLLIDGFDGSGLPQALSEQAFYDSCRARLGAGGLLVANLCDNSRAFATLVRRIAGSFDGRAIAIPAERRGNRVVFASADPAFPPSFEALKSAARHLPSGDAVDYPVKARRIIPALRGWVELQPSPTIGC
ncbi:fused MFS/spermidine synthase [Sphingobium yanoikuyae]|jgi:spermidine synthase|uniref:Fused MFS/spermidine synthase n=1 Tax=Sphingobium yanoikuyae TaxID=13690 RepID=A0AA43BAX2_SPHYA|nr:MULTISPECIES: fused MFS/spermidine synthase [Sphingobium]MDH2130694.1 fused MFS/spermidine synthase [Sphingobium yanoikuyae]MDH2149852.1 fused MFS/spermidine synthase [Sphingobium yanoikuyae]MDH2166109.1 fused MFS/spermidine synthase [Sphingobium yanoikuyae]